MFKIYVAKICLYMAYLELQHLTLPDKDDAMQFKGKYKD